MADGSKHESRREKFSPVTFTDMLSGSTTLWLCLEFGSYLALYAFLISTELVPWLLETAPNACRSQSRCARDLVEDGAWFPGGALDVSDDQMRRFREGFLLLASFAVAHSVLSRIIRYLAWSMCVPSLQFGAHAAIGLVFVFFLHGWQAIFIVGAAAASWLLVVAALRSGAPSWLRAAGVPALVWGGTVALRMYAEVRRDRARLDWVADALCPGAVEGVEGGEGGEGSCREAVAWLSGWSGMVGWHASYPLLMLRVISYACDAAWAQGEERGTVTTGGGALEASKGAGPGAGRGRQGKDGAAAAASGSPREGPKAIPPPPSRPRSASVMLALTPLPDEAYFRLDAALAYFFFPAVYLSGPTLTFNSFAAQMRAQEPVVGAWAVAAYGARFLASGLLLELILEYVPVFGLVYHKPYARLDATAFAGIGLVSIFVLWLKFLVIWRFARLWALAAGVDPPENMKRCVYNNYSVQGFWRGWHCSYNRWVMRYIYFPLGGGRHGLLRRLLNIAVVFTFVALWHDVNPKLLTWGWLIALAFVPELLSAWYVGRPQADWLTRRWWFRYVAGAAGTVQVLGLIVANVIGFAVGPEGTMALVRGMATGGGGGERQGSGGRPAADPAWVLAGAFAVLFGGVQWMFLARGLQEGWNPLGGSEGVGKGGEGVEGDLGKVDPGAPEKGGRKRVHG